MQQQQEQPVQIDQTLPAIPGYAKLSTFAHQWVSLRLGTPSLDLQGEIPQEEEVVVDSQEEAIPEAGAADSQEEEDQPTLKEDIKETN